MTFQQDRAHALVVGIARYKHIRPLPEVKDAAAIRDALVDPNRCGYRPENVALLQDEGATLPALRAALRHLRERVERTGPGSSAFVYFSGHGGRVADGPGAGQYLLPVEVEYPDDARLAATALPDREFAAALKDVTAQKMLVVLDCCHAGGVAQAKDARPPAPAPAPLTDYDLLRGGDGRVVLASSRADELSWVLDGDEYGLFTRHLLDGLNGGAASDDGFVKVFDLFEYVQPRVTAARRTQRPYFVGEVGSNFPIALFKGGQKGTVAKVDDRYKYDVYVSFVDRPPDGDWVWGTLLPRLRDAGLRVAISEEVLEPGVARVVGIGRAIEESRRTIAVLSEAYLADGGAQFDNVLAQTQGILQGTYPLIPLIHAPIPSDRIPLRFKQLQMTDLSNLARAAVRFDTLIKALKRPLAPVAG